MREENDLVFGALVVELDQLDVFVEVVSLEIYGFSLWLGDIDWHVLKLSRCL